MSTSIDVKSQGMVPKLRELTFSGQGMPGFEHLTRFTLTEYDTQTPFYLLASQEDKNVTFIVMEPAFLLEDYAFDLSDELAEELAIQSAEDVFVLVILTVPEQVVQMTANLAGPLVFNRHTNRGRQLVLDPAVYPLRMPLFPDGLPQDSGAEKD